MSKETAASRNSDKFTMKIIVFSHNVENFTTPFCTLTTVLGSLQQCLHGELFLKGIYLNKKIKAP